MVAFFDFLGHSPGLSLISQALLHVVGDITVRKDNANAESQTRPIKNTTPIRKYRHWREENTKFGFSLALLLYQFGPDRRPPISGKGANATSCGDRLNPPGSHLRSFPSFGENCQDYQCAMQPSFDSGKEKYRPEMTIRSVYGRIHRQNQSQLKEMYMRHQGPENKGISK